MASQNYIIARENILIEAVRFARAGNPVPMDSTRRALREAQEAWAIESAQGGNHANRDCWGTLGVNALCLGRSCPDLRGECNRLADLIGVHRMGR